MSKYSRIKSSRNYFWVSTLYDLILFFIFMHLRSEQSNYSGIENQSIFKKSSFSVTALLLVSPFVEQVCMIQVHRLL